MIGFIFEEERLSEAGEAEGSFDEVDGDNGEDVGGGFDSEEKFLEERHVFVFFVVVVIVIIIVVVGGGG